MSKRVTIDDVARKAGVSMMTVSRVINKKEGVSAETSQRILAIIDELGYRPSSLARGLATNKTATIGLVIPDIGNPFFSDFARGVEHSAYAHGYSVFLCNTDEDVSREISLIDSLEEKRVDGLILCSPRLDDETLCRTLKHFPNAVLVNRTLGLPGDECMNSAVDNDDYLGAILAVEHLIQAGHTEIGFLAGPEASISSQKRIRGFQAAFEENQLPYESEWVWPCHPNAEAAKTTASEFLAKYPQITALFCYNDLVAVGALNAAANMNCQVPEELAIVGFDDIPVASLVRPALTTVRVARHQLGIEAINLLLSQIENSANPGQVITLKPDLIVRQSAP